MRSAGLLAVLVLTLGTTACGGDEPDLMPDVGAARLDVALSDLERSGLEEPEVLGGGVFGVVDESAWFVCDQEPPAGEVVSATPRLTVERECSEPAEGEAGAGKEEATPAPRDASTKDKSRSQPQAAPVEETFAMPALVGADLQDAQDLLQTADSFLLTQTDATGLERFQVLDSGWKVCGQSPAAGVETSISTMVELAVVKTDEACP